MKKCKLPTHKMDSSGSIFPFGDQLNVLGIFLFFLFTNCDKAHNNDIYTSDIIHFWEAYDSVVIEPDSQKQIGLMQRLYIDKGTSGLEAFMELRNFDAERLVTVINDYPKFWKSIRSNTMKVHEKTSEINQYVRRFKELYPACGEAKIYFTITAIRSGGTTKDSLVLIGTEIATGNSGTDVSEFPDKRLENFFKNQKKDNIIPFAIHEYVHTQQNTEGHTLLGQSIYEGVCDFVTELVLDHKLGHAYLEYGRENEDKLKRKFKKVMWGTDWDDWLYNGNDAKTVGDLGYFMGYAICKSFYAQAKNKEKAIARMIELDYMDHSEISLFLEESEYYSE